ncbi:MAG: efflux RND transporter periplasmic adaptor subunit [Rhodospirillaceae bacterium]|nr:efflux RND transporter periplasmic adaptor subunit [Rhodospirillaceae bacterium]
MRILTQAIILTALVGTAGGGWYLWKQNATAANPVAARGGGRPQAPALQVEAAAARVGEVVDSIEAVGTARSNEAVTITAKQTGTIFAVLVAEGQKVKAGAPLIEFESQERRANLDQMRAQRDDVGQKLERARQLRTAGNASQATVDALDAQFRSADAQVKASEARLGDIRLTAPFDGRVGMRQVSPGALVQPGTAITTLDDVSKIKIEFSVPEIVLAALKPGLAVVARTAAHGARTFTGTVTTVDTRVDAVTRSVRTNAVFDNTDEALKPGMFMTVELSLGRRANAVLIPEEALLPEGIKQYVFAVRDGRAIKTEVHLGRRLPGEIEIASGLVAGDVVVTRGIQKIRDGQAVSVRGAATEPPNARSPGSGNPNGGAPRGPRPNA